MMDTELHRTREQLAQLEEALASLREEVYQHSPDRFRLMAESYVREIGTLRARIDELIGVKLAFDISTDVMLKITSPLYLDGSAPAPVVAKTISAVQRGLQRLGEYVARTQFQVGDTVSRQMLNRQFEFDIVTVLPGSFQVALRLAEVAEPSVPRESAAEALRRLAHAVVHAARQAPGREWFRRLVPDLTFQLQFLQALKDIAPSRRRRELRVEFHGRFLPDEHIVFDPDTRSYLGDLIKATVGSATEEGVVREVDLDRRTFRVRTEAALLLCRYGQELSDRVKSALDKRVRVAGRASIRHDGRIRYLTVREISVLEG